MNWTIALLGLISFFLFIIIFQLAGLRRSFNILGQIVAVGIQKAGLVRTPEQAEEDARKAHEEEEEESEGDVF